MNLKLYGICFKMRGGPDLLDYVKTNTAVPVDIMEQVMSQISSITQDEIDFAMKLDNDWKKAFNEKVPLSMGVAPDGGYDITCNVPDELINTVSILYDMEHEKIVEEYTANYLKEICGIDAPIISVDMEVVETVPQAAPVKGFDLSDLTDVPDAPAFEDVSEFPDIDANVDEQTTAHVSAYVSPTVNHEDDIPDEDDMSYSDDIPDDDTSYEDDVTDGDDIPYDNDIPDDDEPDYEEDGVPIEEGYPENEDFPDVDDEQEEESHGQALTKIYTELVENIKDKKLDERLGLRIGQ